MSEESVLRKWEELMNEENEIMDLPGFTITQTNWQLVSNHNHIMYQNNSVIKML